MTTSLQRQLNALASPASALLVPERKISSILFTPQEATKHKREVFYDLGCNGLAELIKIDPDVFKKFSYCQLFDAESKTFERIVQDKEANEKLDEILEEFLISLSPYLMLKASLKCMEWLVNRFHIEKFNVNLIMQSFIPYYDTKVFSLVVQVLDVNKRSSDWQWIIPNIQTGLPISKADLFSQGNSQFIVWIFSTLEKFMKVHEDKPENLRTFISFITSTITGILSRISTDLRTANKSKLIKTHSKAQSIIHSLWSQLHNLSLRIRNSQLKSNEEIQSMIYVICAVLFNTVKDRADLLRGSQDAVNGVMLTILRHHPRSLKTQAHLLLNLLSSGTDCQISLTNKKHLTRALSEISILSSDWDLWYLSSKLVLHHTLQFKLSPSELWKIVGSIEFTVAQRSTILRSVYAIWRSSKQSRKWIKEFLTRFERQYPLEFSMACKKSKKFASGLAKVTKEKNFELLSQHPESDIRKAAVKQLIRKFKLKYLKSPENSDSLLEENKNSNKAGKRLNVTLKKKSPTKTKKLKAAIPDDNSCAQALLPRFNDDNYEVIHLLIMKKTNLLTKIFSVETLVKQLIDISYRDNCDKKCKKKALLQLCKLAEGLGTSESDRLLMSKIFTVLIPYLFPRTKFGLKLCIVILNTPFGNQNPFLRQFSKFTTEDGVSRDEICDFSYDCITSSLQSDFLCKNWGMDFTNASSAVFAVLSTKSKDGFNELMEGVGKFEYKGLTTSWRLSKQCFPNCIRLASKKGLLALELIFTTIFNLNLKAFEDIERVVKFVLRLCENTENRHMCVNFLKDFMKKQFPVASDQLSFWNSMLLAVNHMNGTSVISTSNKIAEFFTIRILQCLYYFILEEKEVTRPVRKQPDVINFKTSTLMDSILVLCIDSDSYHLRLWGMNCLEVLGENTFSDLDFLKYILGFRREILADREQGAIVISKAFKDQEFSATRDRYIDMIVESKHQQNNEFMTVGLLRMFRFASYAIFTKFLGLAKELLLADPNSRKLLAILRCFDGTLDDSTFGILNEALKHTQPCLIILSKITTEVFDTYNIATKKKLIALLIDVILFSKTAEVKVIIQRRIRKWILEASIISLELEKCIKMEKLLSSNTNVTSSRKSLRSSSVSESAFGDVDWTHRTEVVLEFIQSKKKLKQKSILILPLFKLLKTCIALEEQTPVEYLKQLILTSLTLCCSGEESARKEDSGDWIHFNVETVIDCLRCSRNPQTHHHALILLNYAAKKFPEQVLHGVMSLFTFMGNSILRQDDAYSTQLIQQTVTTIIPTLANTTSVRQFSKSLVSAGIFRVFTCAVQDIPVHRRLPVFISLVDTLEPLDSMWQACVIIVDNALTRDKKRSHLNADLELATDIVWHFDPNVVLGTMEKVYSYLMELPIYERNMTPESYLKIRNGQDPHAKSIIDLSRKDTLRDAEIIVLFTIELVAKICGKFGELDKHGKLSYDSLLEKCLSLSRFAASNSEDKMLRLIGQKNFEVIEKINIALEPPDFVRITVAIILRGDTNVKRRMIDLLNQRILHQSDWFKDLSILLEVIPHLVELGKFAPETDEEVTLVQTTFLSLKVIAKHLAPTSPEEFVPVFELAIRQARHKNKLLRASALLCMGELFCLRSLILPNLANVRSAITKAFKESIKLSSNSSKDVSATIASQDEEDNAEKSNEGNTSISTAHLLCISALSCFNKSVEHLGPFLSSTFQQKLLLTIFSIDGVFGEGVKSENRKKLFEQRLKTLLKSMGSKIPLRNLIITIKEVFAKLEGWEDCSLKFKSLLLLIGLFNESLSLSVKSDVTPLLPSICDLFLQHLLLFRESTCVAEVSKDSSLMTVQQIDEVETKILECLVTGMVLKMSEGVFRPFYHKMYDWASDNTLRLITFYRFSGMAAERLKSLFVTFAGFVISEASKQLTLDATLTRAILSYFYQIFLNDREGFITIDRFNALVKPLIDLIESEFTLSGEIPIKQLNETLIQLAVASNDLNRWQHMIDLLSLKTRNENPKVRLFVISTIETAATELGKDFLPLLPPAVPFLAEMLDDDDDEVEKQTKKMLRKLEGLLGEPLQPYFTI